MKFKSINEDKIKDLIRASVLTEELFYPHQQARLDNARVENNELAEEINNIFFTSSPFQRVLKGENYEDVEKSLKEEIENYTNGLIKTKI